MKVAHLAVITPGRCGLYETTRELVTALRNAGVDSRLVDPTRETNKLYPNGTEDRGAWFAGMEWAKTADVLVNHSGYDKTPVAKTDQPIVHVAHGRPRSSFLSEMKGDTPIYSYHYQHNRDPRWKAVVTFWPEHIPYLEVMFPDKPVIHVPACVDLDAWNSDGPGGYDFHGKKGEINVVCTDAFRDDIDPFVPLNAFALWARKQRGAKVHIYAMQNQKGWGPLLKQISDDGNLGEATGWVKGLDHVYRAADFMITAHDIDTRSVREAMACGCPVVRVQNLNAIPNFDHDPDRDRWRRRACARFNPEKTAAAFKAILEKV